MGSPLHAIWEKSPEEMCRRAMKIAKSGYRFWVGGYVLAVVLSIGFPIISLVIVEPFSQWFAVLAAIAAGLNAAVRPSEKATIYDVAVQDIWAARLTYIHTNDASALVRELTRTIENMKIRYADMVVLVDKGHDRKDQRSDRHSDDEM